MPVEKMRSEIMKVYQTTKHNAWTERVSKMPGNQVMAVYHSFVQRGKIK